MKPYCTCKEDWKLASNVQQLLLPKAVPDRDWCSIGVRNRMAASLGGDYFDFIELPDGCQVIFIGDVTGHGTHASVVMALLYGYLHRLTTEGCSPYHVIEQVNLFLQNFARRSVEFDHYFSSTLFYGIIDPRRLSMSYVNAGHVAPLVLHGDKIYHLGATTAPVGFFDIPEIEVHNFHFDSGDRMLLVTDGIVELANPGGENFGVDRLERLLRESSPDHTQLFDQLFGELEVFRGSRAPEDDCTAIVMDFSCPALRQD